jgi:hypothetical protein
VSVGAGISRFSCNHTTSQDDWAVSPISIRERGLVGSAQSAKEYAPNLNFHWAGRVSRSLTMLANGNFVLGEWTGSGSPQESSGLSSLNLGELKLNNQIVVDGSRNLVNIAQLSSTGSHLVATTSGVGVGGTPADENSAELGAGFLNLARDDTAQAKQIQFAKNGAVHSYIATQSADILYDTTSGRHTFALSGSSAFNISTTGTSAVGTITAPNFKTTTGGYLIGTTQVISSARQLQNISSVSGNMNFLNVIQLGNLSFAQKQNDGFNVGAIDDDDENLILKGFGGSTEITLGDGAITITGNTSISGSLSKTSGSFKIDHPLKPDTHHLVHSFVESPQADNLYRGVIDLHNGRATIDLDDWFGMTPGTFLALNRDIQAFVNNADTWDNVRAKVMGSQLVIECQNPESNAEVSWLVIGERQDKEIHESSLTDNHGKVIVEPQKVG